MRRVGATPPRSRISRRQYRPTRERREARRLALWRRRDRVTPAPCLVSPRLAGAPRGLPAGLGSRWRLARGRAVVRAGSASARGIEHRGPPREARRTSTGPDPAGRRWPCRGDAAGRRHRRRLICERPSRIHWSPRPTLGPARCRTTASRESVATSSARTQPTSPRFVTGRVKFPT